MYKQLTSEQRSQIFALLQRNSPRKEIAHIVGISQSTLSRELKRKGSPSGKYVWFKAHDKAMERRKRSTSNAALAPELVWRIKQAIIGEQWSPRQISGCRVKHPNASSTEKYNNFALAGWLYMIILINGCFKIFARNICHVIRKFLYLQLIITTLLLATSY